MEIMSKERWQEWTEVFREERAREALSEQSNGNGHPNVWCWPVMRQAWREEL